MTRRPHYFVLVLPLLVCAFFLAVVLARSLTAPVTKIASSPLEFVVTRGDTTIKIADNLYASGLIRSPLGFRYLVKKHHLGADLQAGTYYLSPTLNTLAIANTLTRGISDLRLTIPEGFRLEEIADTLETKMGLSRSEFLSQAKDLEGSLFPDTYYLAPSSSVATVIKVMQDNFVTKVGQVDAHTLILASLLERETSGDDEKPLVAGILEKRLAAGWALELDATVQYVLGKKGEWWPQTTLADRSFTSAYNTYLNQGLPPTPICNPGLSSINAARTPKASDYWFYLHDKEGEIHYARTLEEHNQNISRYIY